MLSISGGRWYYDTAAKTVILPVGYGYKVLVKYNEGADDYTVQRILVRKANVTLRGEWPGVQCDNLGNVAYRASLF